MTLGAFSPAAPIFGQMVTLSANVTSADGTPAGTLTFSVDGTNLAPVTVSGGSASVQTSALAAGMHMVIATFTSSDGSFATASSTSGSLTIGQASPAITFAPPQPSISYGTQLASSLNATSTVAGTFSYTAQPTGGTAGPVTATTILDAGTYTLTASLTPTDTTDYTTATQSTTLTVTQASVTPLLSIVSTTPVYGTPNSATITLSAVAGTPTGTVQFTLDGTASGAPVAVSSGTAHYVLPTLSAGKHVVAATYSGDTDFSSAAVAGLTITVAQATPVVNWVTPAAIPYGTALNAAQLNASSTVPGVFTYTPAAGAVLSAGNQTINVVFTPADSTDYVSGSATVVLIVTKATPTITWATPASIVASTPLSAVQLNATSSVPGAFVYTPPIGTVLPAGVQTLNTTFTPTDTTDYTTATASVILTVVPPTVNFSVSSINQTYPTWANFVVAPTNTGKVPTGTVTILDAGTPLVTLTLGGDGKAYWTTNPPLNAGTHTITVSYSGDQNYPPGGSTIQTVTVAPAPVKMSISCWGGSPYGVSYTCQASLSSSAGSATGSIGYTFDGGAPVSVPISGGSTQFVISQPQAGSHQVVISYAGQGNYAGVQSQTVNFTTQPGTTQLQLSPSSYYLKSGSSLTLTASASTPQSGVPAGTVTFYDNGASIGAAAAGSNGVSVFVIPSISKGQHSFTAVFVGTSNYAGATSGSANVSAY